MTKKRQTSPGYCLLCPPTKGLNGGFGSRATYNTHVKHGQHKRLFAAWENKDGNKERYPLATLDDFFVEAHDMDRDSVVNDRFDWAKWYEGVTLLRLARPRTPPLAPSLTAPPPAPPPFSSSSSNSSATSTSAPQQPDPIIAGAGSSHVSSGGGGDSWDPMDIDQRDPSPQPSSVRLRPSAMSDLEDDGDRPKSPDSTTSSSSSDHDLADEYEYQLCLQRDMDETNLTRALARARLGNAVANVPPPPSRRLPDHRPRISSLQDQQSPTTGSSAAAAAAAAGAAGAGVGTAIGAVAFASDGGGGDHRHDLETFGGVGQGEEAGGGIGNRRDVQDRRGDGGQAQHGHEDAEEDEEDVMDQMRQELLVQQAEKAAEAVRFSLSALSTRKDWAPPGPHFPWLSRLPAVIFTRLARNVHAQTRPGVQLTIDVLEVTHPGERIPTINEVLTLPAGFPAPQLSTIENDQGHKFTVILPSHSLPFLIGRPDIFKEIIRFPTDSESIIESFCDTKRARELFSGFQSATFRSSSGVNFFVGNTVRYKPASDPFLTVRYGRISHIYQTKTDSSIMVLLSCIESSQALAARFPGFAAVRDVYPNAWWETSRSVSLHASVLATPRPAVLSVTGTVSLDHSTYLVFSEEEHTAYHAPHPLQACGLLIITIFLALWADEAKGTTSVRHDHHETMAYQLLNVPAQVNRHLENIGFIAAVPQKSGTCYEVATAVIKDIQEHFAKGLECVVADPSAPGGYQKVVITGGIGCCLGDSPKVCLFCSHMGVQARFNCPFCKFDQNTMSIGTVAEARTKEWTLSRQSDLVHNPPSNKQQAVESVGVQPRPDYPNPFMFIRNLDPHRDCPLDALHLGPLGLVKFLAELLIGKKPFSSDLLKAAKFLDAMDWSSFSLRLLGMRLLEHWGSFVGRDLKVFIQVAAAFARAMGPRPRFAQLLACILAGFVRLLYAPTSRPLDLVTYKEQLKRWGDKFYDLLRRTDELKAYMDGKIKPHYVAHAPDVADLYGNLNLYATETMERLNRYIRQSLITSNHHNTSRSAATDFATQLGIEFIKNGGMWAGPNGSVHQAGEEIKNLLQHTRVISEAPSASDSAEPPGPSSSSSQVPTSLPTQTRVGLVFFRRATAQITPPARDSCIEIPVAAWPSTSSHSPVRSRLRLRHCAIEAIARI